MNIPYAIVFVSHMSQATAFYRDVVGIPLRFESPGWTEFETGGCTLALHATTNPAPETPGGSEAASLCRIGFNVQDLDAFHARMQEHDVPCVQEPQERFGARMAQYRGPDGMVFGISESRTG